MVASLGPSIEQLTYWQISFELHVSAGHYANSL